MFQNSYFSKFLEQKNKYIEMHFSDFIDKKCIFGVAGVCVCLTVGLGQVLVQLLPVVLVQDVVDAGVDQLLLFVLQVLRHIVRHEHDASLSVHHEQEAVQSLRAQTPQVTTADQNRPHPTPPSLRASWTHLQQERPEVVLIDDALARRGHV